MEVLAFFEWIDTSWLAALSKSSGSIFAVIQTVHLGAMALLGGMVLVSDLRLLNVLMPDVPSETVVDATNRWIDIALILMILSGIYLMSAVAIKLYWNYFFWSKMAALATGIVFMYAVKRPLLRNSHKTINPWTLRLVAVSSLAIWFTVAASGRWIGFS